MIYVETVLRLHIQKNLYVIRQGFRSFSGKYNFQLEGIAAWILIKKVNTKKSYGE